MKRIFVFSYHGKESFQTGFNRLLSIAESLSKSYEVHFVYGDRNKSKGPVKTRENLVEIPLSYSSSSLHNFYKYLLDNGRRRIAKLLLITYYFFTGKEIFDLGREFNKYKKNTNITLSKDDIVIVSFPSITVHNLGYALKQEFGCKLILDYRDPGVFGYQLIEENKILSFLRRFFLKRRELRNLKSADLIITISDSIRRLFPEKYANSVEVIRNGYDAKKINFDRISYHSSTFNLVYLGSVYNDQLVDITFFKAVRKFINTHAIQPQNFQLRFIGTGESIRLKEVIKHFHLDPYTYIGQKMPIEQIYDELYGATLFFHLKYGERKEIITTKQYEYLAFQKPILLPINDYGDLEESIKKYSAGFICENEDEIVKILEKTYNEHVQGKAVKITRTAEELYQLSRQAQEEKLLKLIEKL